MEPQINTGNTNSKLRKPDITRVWRYVAVALFFQIGINTGCYLWFDLVLFVFLRQV